MLPFLSQPHPISILPKTAGLQLTEAEVIAGRIASARHWRRRRRVLRLRATLFGRAKARPTARSAAPRSPQAACGPRPQAI